MPLIEKMPRGGGCCGAGDAVRGGRVVDRYQHLGLEAVVGFPNGEALRLGLVTLTEGALVHEGKVGRVKGVFHHAQRTGVPGFVKLVNAPVSRITLFGCVHDGC